MYFPFVLLTLLCTSAALATEWEVRQNKDGILIESRKAEGSRYEEFRANTRATANIAGVIALLRDTDAYPRWVFRCQESRTIEEISSTERTFYQVTDLPFPARSRDVIFHAKVSYHPDDTVQIRITARPEVLAETGHVRIREAHGSYLLEPVGETQTNVTWRLHVDPAGALPSWLVNGMLTDLPYKSLKALRELVTAPPYSSSIMVYNDDGLPVDIMQETGSASVPGTPDPADTPWQPDLPRSR